MTDGLMTVLSIIGEFFKIVYYHFSCRDIRETGYVRTVFDMGVEGREVTQEQIVDEFEEFFEIGTMGPLRVKRDGFSVVDVGAGGMSDLSGTCAYISE